jgi:hypothetical protein
VNEPREIQPGGRDRGREEEREGGEEVDSEKRVEDEKTRSRCVIKGGNRGREGEREGLTYLCAHKDTCLAPSCKKCSYVSSMTNQAPAA